MIWGRYPILPAFMWIAEPVFFYRSMSQQRLLNTLILCPVICNAISVTLQMSISKWFHFQALHPCGSIALFELLRLYNECQYSKRISPLSPPHPIFSLLFLLKPHPHSFSFAIFKLIFFFKFFEKRYWDFYWDYIEFIGKLEKNAIFKILHPPIHEYSESLFLPPFNKVLLFSP